MIIRRKHTGNFAVIPNATANDDRVGAEALGILVYLLAKPEDWKVTIPDLRKRFGMGRDAVYGVLAELEGAGYVRRSQGRTDGRSTFTSIEYVVYDCPQAAKPEADHQDVSPLPDSPYPEIQEAVKSQQNAASGFTVSGSTVSGKSGHILKTDITKPLSEEKSASDEASADAPSVSKMVWKEGRELLEASSSKPNSSIIGKWLKRTVSEEAKIKLLEIIRAAARAGTDDPVGYITAALNREYPPPEDPASFDRATWQRKIQAALNTRAWPAEWGPAPGHRGCKVPTDLVTAALVQAIAGQSSRAA